MRTRGVDAVINPRSTPYREKGYKDDPPSIQEALDGIEEDPNLLRRPLLMRGQEVVFGFDEGEYGRVVG
jgi:arsenate reductase-like glutaredoxin family protein